MKKKIVVYGGAFNPPLNSHFSIAEQVINQFDDVYKVIFVPVNKLYEKDGLIANEHRLNMLKLVIDKNDDFLLSDIDMKEKRSLYTIETLDLIQNQFPDKEICFLTGSDNLKGIHSWKNAELLVSKYMIMVMERDNDNVDDIIENDELLLSNKNNILKIDNNIKSNFSSTYVRKQIKNKKNVRYLMPDEVYYYILENKLYLGDDI